MFLLIAISGFVVFIISCLVEPGIFALQLASVGCAIFNVATFVEINRADRHYWSYKFFIFYFVIQPIVFFLLVSFFPYPMEKFLGVTSLLIAPPVSIFYSCSLVLLLALLFSIFVKYTHRQRESNFRKYLYLSDGRLSVLLAFTGLVSGSIWFHHFIPGVFGYVARILHRAFELMPLLAGMYFKKSKLVRYVWLGSLLLSFVLAFFTGSRGYFFYPAAFYCVGYFMQERRPRARLLLIAIGIAALLPTLFMVGFIGNLRQELGRKSLGEVDFGMVVSNLDKVVSKSFDESASGLKVEKDDPMYVGLSRLMDMTLFLVPNMTPNPVEYRTYSDIFYELRELYMIVGANRTAGYVYPSRLVPNNYGIKTYIHVDYSGKVRSFTVPFNILPDSWSRGGLFSSVAQISIAFMFFAFMERLNEKLFRGQPAVYVMGQFVLIGLAFRFMTAYTLIATMRQVLFTYTFCVIVLMAVNYVSRHWVRAVSVPIRHPRG